MKKKIVFTGLSLFLLSYLSPCAFAKDPDLKCASVAETRMLEIAIDEMELTPEEFFKEVTLKYSEVSDDGKSEEYRWSYGSGGTGITIQPLYFKKEKSDKKETLFCIVTEIYALQDDGDDEDSSQIISEIVEAITPLARSGVDTYEVTPGSSVKEMLYALALKLDVVEDESDFNWVEGLSDEAAWEPDSTNWGETTLEDAISYITTVDEDYEEGLNKKDKLKYKNNIKKAVEAVKLFEDTGVLFGVVPLGAAQGGVQLAALAIIDPSTGTIYVFSKEGSGD